MRGSHWGSRIHAVSMTRWRRDDDEDQIFAMAIAEGMRDAGRHVHALSGSLASIGWIIPDRATNGATVNFSPCASQSVATAFHQACVTR